MFKRNLIKQVGYKDCGPACLLMIIKHYKGNISLEKLKEMCKTNKNGTTAYDLIEASRECGFTAHGIKCKIEEFSSEMILPCIVHIILDNSYNHYIVIYKVDFKKQKVYIADPIGKTKIYTFKEFDKIYTNIMIVLYPSFNLPCEKDTSINVFIKEIIKMSKRQLSYLIILSVLITVLSIISTFYLQYIIDNLNKGYGKIILIFIIFSIIYLLKIITDYIRNYLLILINQKIDLNLTCKAFKQIIFLPYRHYHNHTTGEIISKITDLKSVKEVISKVAISLFIDLPLTIIALIVLYMINSKLCFIALIMLILYIILIYAFKSNYQNSINKIQIKNANTSSYIYESISGFESVKGCIMEDKINLTMEGKYVNLSNENAKFEHLYNFQHFLKRLINDGGFLIIILIGASLVMKDKITIGSLLSFNTLLVYFLEPILKVIDLDTNIKEAKNAIKRFINLMEQEENQGIIDKKMKGEIKIKNLNYSFDDTIVLKNINLNIKKGSKILIIGESGSGKSTLLKILKGYYKVKRGKVMISDIDINDYKNNDIVYVSQNETLFTDTIYNNIGSSDNFMEIAKMCLVDEFVNSNLGYNSLIEENGFNISGGQKQRIILARALNREFNILLIDEGLNQVDVNKERIILKNIFKKYKDKTIIIVSHRMDNNDLFDQMIKISKEVILDESYNK